MGTTKHGRLLRALTLTLLLALLAALLLAGSALAAGHDGRATSAKPGKPTATSPKGPITTTTPGQSTATQAKPTFKWKKASRAASYELRVYKGSKLQLKKTGLKKTTYKSTKALPTNVDLTWKVRASNARGAGAWSKSLKFTIVPPVPPSPAKAITAFSFQGLAPPVAGVVDEAAHTVALTVPFGTARNALVATFTTTGAAVTVGGTIQVSGVTANDFTSPVTYTVTAADGSTQAYVVTVTVAAATIGQSYGGGIIAYIFQPGDPGYVAGETHGLIAAAADQTGAEPHQSIQWALPDYQSINLPGALGTALGTGDDNTAAIVTQNGAGVTHAAGLAQAYTGGGYSDWFLPSVDELDKLYQNRAAIGGFGVVAPVYWTSTQHASIASTACQQSFDNGDKSYSAKFITCRVRAVRAF
jgi:hypothetical protein